MSYVTSNPTDPHKAAQAKFKATTKRVSPLTADGAKARVKAAQRYYDNQGKAERVAKAQKQKAAAAKIAAKHNR